MKKILFLFVMALPSMMINAETVEIDGIYYNLDSENKTADVTYRRGIRPNIKYYYSGDVVIPSTVNYENTQYSVISIENSAFSGNKDVTSVTLQSGMKTIADNAFRGCTGLISILFSNSLVSIGNYAFSGCSALKSITIPNSVTSIGEHAFFHCSSLQSLILSNTITNIGQYAFSNCCSIETISLPENLTSISNSCFEQCTSLSSVIIPNNLKSIGYQAFWNCTNLTTIEIPNSVTTIEDGAFSHCNNLTSVNIPNNMTNINGRVFEECTSLVSVIIPNSITSVEGMAFSGCTKLSSITLPNSVISIGSRAFEGCICLNSITIPSSVTNIGDKAFSGCKKLKKLHVDDSDNVLSFEQEKRTATYTPKKFNFFDCPLDTIYLGRDYTYTTISPFKDNTSISVLEFGDKVTAVGINDFYNCSSIESIKLGGSVKTIGGFAFWGNQSLKTIVIPNSVTYLGRGAFLSCDNLVEVIIEEGTETLGFEVNFSDCNCFAGPIKKIFLGRNVSCYHSPFPGFYTYSVPFELTIGKTVTTLGSGVFQNCKGITKLIFEAGTEPLAFDNSLFMPFSDTPIDSIYLDRNLICTNNNNPSVSFCPFSGVPSILSFEIGNHVDEICSYLMDSMCKITSLRIPNNIRKVGANAFQNCGQLSSVIIEDGTESLDFKSGDNFMGCPLDSVYLGRNIKYNTNSPFRYNKEGIKSLTFGEYVTELGDVDFLGHIGLTTLELPHNLKKIGSQTFYGCKGLTSLTIPNSVTEIGEQAFDLCTSLKSVTIEDGTEELAFVAEQGFVTSTFSNSPLEEITIGRNFSFASVSPFSIQDNLSSITIGEKVTKLDDKSFTACPKLVNVTSYSEVVPTINDMAFTPSYLSNGTLHVPYSLYDQYKVTPQWKDFGKIVNFEGLYNLVYIVDGVEYKKSVIEQGTSIIAEEEPSKEGYTFSGWSEIPETMPAHDVTVTGTFTINKYKLIYKVDDAEYKSYEVEYGASITAETEPTKEGYTFSGWSEIPDSMPAHDVTVTGTFSINSYKLTYVIDEKVYKETMYEYGATITPEPQPEGDYQTFEWTDLPETMPAHDVVVYATYTSGIAEVLMDTQRKARIYSPNGKKLDKPQKGLNIVIFNDGTVKKMVVK